MCWEYKPISYSSSLELPEYQLAFLMNTKLGTRFTSAEPLDKFIRDNWDEVARLAHAIHEPFPVGAEYNRPQTPVGTTLPGIWKRIK